MPTRCRRCAPRGWSEAGWTLRCQLQDLPHLRRTVDPARVSRDPGRAHSLFRHAIERMEPRHYLSASYYERSFTSLATLCVEKGIVSREELERRAEGSVPLSTASAPGRTNVPGRERFQIGDRVRVRDDHVPGHVR